MNKFFYPKLAATNIRKNSKTYIPYIIACTCTIIMCYMMSMLAQNSSLRNMTGGDYLPVIFNFGTWIIIIFAVIFIFYTNSFLAKRRKKEFGLYNILGMEKRHISIMVLFETLYVAAICLFAGLGGGILLSKLMILALTKILRFDVNLEFEIPAAALIGTLVFFTIIFLLTLIKTIFQVQLSKPVELLSGGHVGEKEPKTKWLLAIIGVICLGVGYYIAITTESPLDALLLFFVAVILVIIGTYALFTAGSIALLKILRKNKSYYYKPKHFISVSGMMYRMKQNAVGLASICILSTMVLIMVAGTVSLYLGTEDAITTRYSKNISIYNTSIENSETEIEQAVNQLAEKYNAEPKNTLYYHYLSLSAQRVTEKGSYFDNGVTGYNSEASYFSLIPLEDFNRLENQNITLEPDEVLLYEMKGSIGGDYVQLGDLKYKIKDRLESLNTEGSQTAMIMESFYLIVPDSATLEDIWTELLSEEPGVYKTFYYGFDLDLEDEAEKQFSTELSGELQNTLGIDCYIESAAQNRTDIYSMYGGFLFLGIFLGLLFIMATVLIIYYKQISEGYEDKERFEIMQKVGMSQHEVKKSISGQVVTVFFLPLIAAGIHVIASFKMVTKLLSTLNLYNVTLFGICTAATFLVFALVYTIIYFLTAREYYKIVKY